MPNAYVAGPTVFPVIGSANPSLTAATLARRTADAIVASRTISPDPAFKPLFTGSRQGWVMPGGGDFAALFGSILEATPNGLASCGIPERYSEALRSGLIGFLSIPPQTYQVGARIIRGFSSDFLLSMPSDPANDWKLASDKAKDPDR